MVQGRNSAIGVAAVERPWVEFRKWPYEEGVWHLEIAAADGRFGACQDFYASESQILEFARELQAFPRHREHAVVLEVGQRDPKWAHWVYLRGFLVDPLGRAALVVEVSTNREDPHRREAHFSILCEVASLNRLGQLLARWIVEDDSTCRVELTPSS